MAKVWDKPITAETDWGGDASTGGLPVSGRMVQAYIKERLALASSKEDIEQFVKDYLEEIGMASDGGFVTLASEQIVKAIKDFAEGIKLNGSPLITYDAEKNAYVFPANVIAEGGIAAFSSLEEYDIPTIMDAVVTDEVTISKIGGVLQVLKAGLDKEELIAILEAEKYVDETWVKNFCVKYALAEDVVDLKSRQNITGIKNFVNGLEVGGKILKYDATKNAFILRANIIAEGGITAWGSLEGYDIPTIMDAINVDGQTIIKEDGMLKLNPNIDLGGGLDESQLEEYLATKQYAKKGDIATALIGYATQSWVTGRGYITSAALEPYAMKSTTLAGYGITDAYTKTQIDTSVNAINKSITDLRTYTDKTFVKLAVAQDITARHNFTNGLKIGGLSAYKSQEDVVFIDANVVVRGGITAWGDNEQTAPTIWDGFPCDNATIKRGADGLFYAEVQSGGGIDESQLETYLTTNKYAKKDDISSALNGYATQSWVTGRGYITASALEPYALKTSIPTNTNQLTNGAGFITVSAIPTSLKNPNALSWSGYSTGSYDGSTAQSIVLPTKLSQLTDDVVSGKYLSIAGGTVNGDIYSKNYRTDGVVYIQKLRIENTNEINGYTAYNGGEATGNAHINYVSSGIVTLCYGGGNCGVGGIPTEKLHVHGNVLATGDVTTQKSLTAGTTLLAYTGSSSVAYLHITNEAATVDYAHLFVSNSDKSRKDRPLVLQNGYGNVAIGGTSASEKLHVYGNILAAGAITMYYSSDRRLKQNIRKVDASKTLLSLGGIYQYEYIDGEVAKNSTYEGSHFGLIYQNVKGSALDKMCFEREDGMGTLNYLDTNFISLIAGATMENCTEVEKLKKENKALRKRVEQLEKRIA